MVDTPGRMALQAMQKTSTSLTEFKVPNVPKKKEKVKILTEEDYIQELSKIIQRDFFPDLSKLKAQNEYLEAVEKNDVIKLREIYAKYSGKRPRMSGDNSPATFETPMSSANSTPRTKPTSQESTPKTVIEIVEKKTISDGHTLDSFLNSYTSEDNSSFQEIIEAADLKLRQKFAVLYDEEKNFLARLTNSLELPSIEQQFALESGQKDTETWTYKNKNYIMYIPDGVNITKEEQVEMATRKQEIAYNNTRLAHNPFNENQNKETINAMAKSQAKNVTGKIGVDGNVVPPPQFRGFDFVYTPSPCPGEACSPLMTWGEIEGTPFRLDASDTPIRSSVGPSFHINEASRRETIALELAEKAGTRLRNQKQKAIDAARRNIGTPYMRSSMERLASMSPAAKRLATMKLGLRSSIISPSPYNKSTGLLVTPKSLRKRTPSPFVKKKLPATQATNEVSASPEPPSQPDLTDDLLKIPSQRPKASDFF